MSSKSSRKDFADNHIHPRLRRSLRIYLLVSFVVLILVIVSMFRSHANPLIVLCGFIGGVLIGIAFNRINKISWDKDAEKVIGRMDKYGLVLMVFYVGFDIYREHIVEVFTHGPAVGATSLALLAGALVGRVIGTGKVIIEVIKKEKVLSK